MEELETSDAAVATASSTSAEEKQQNSTLELRTRSEETIETVQQSSSSKNSAGRFSAFVTKYRVVQRLKKLSNGASIFQERPPGNEKNQFFTLSLQTDVFSATLLYYFRKVAEKNFKRNSDLKGSKKSSVA